MLDYNKLHPYYLLENSFGYKFEWRFIVWHQNFVYCMFRADILIFFMHRHILKHVFESFVNWKKFQILAQNSPQSKIGTNKPPGGSWQWHFSRNSDTDSCTSRTSFRTSIPVPELVCSNNSCLMSRRDSMMGRRILQNNIND